MQGHEVCVMKPVLRMGHLGDADKALGLESRGLEFKSSRLY